MLENNSKFDLCQRSSSVWGSYHQERWSSASAWVWASCGEELKRGEKGSYFKALHEKQQMWELNQKAFNLPTCTSLTVGAATHGGAFNDIAILVHTPTVAGGVPALHGQVVALLVTLGLVGTDLAGSCELLLAFGLDHSDCGRSIGTLMSGINHYWWHRSNNV